MCFRLLQRSLPFLFKVHFEGCDLSIFSMQKNQENDTTSFRASVKSVSQMVSLLTVCWPFADRLLTVCWRCHACRPHGECFESICLGILFLLPLDFLPALYRITISRNIFSIFFHSEGTGLPAPVQVSGILLYRSMQESPQIISDGENNLCTLKGLTLQVELRFKYVLSSNNYPNISKCRTVWRAVHYS